MHHYIETLNAKANDTKLLALKSPTPSAECLYQCLTSFGVVGYSEDTYINILSLA